MDAVVHFLGEVVHYAIEIGVYLVELVGVLILLISAIKAIKGYIKKDPGIRLKLGLGISLALEFFLGGEVLHTVIARQWEEVGILGAIMALRAALTILLHWEIKNEENHISHPHEED